MMKIASFIAGTANLMKIAPIHRAFQLRKISHILIDMGLYTKSYMPALFEELRLPHPKVILGSDTNNVSYMETTKETISRLTKALVELAPDMLLIYGDLDGIVAASICARRLRIPLAHIEAGLRNNDPQDTEEFNRIVADRFSDWLFTISEAGNTNLLVEGCSAENIHLVGNTIIDCLKMYLPYSQEDLINKLGMKRNNYGILSIHREKNLTSKSELMGIIEAVEKIQRQIKIVFLIYPATAQALSFHGLDVEVHSMPNLLCLPRLGYLDYLGLLTNTRFVLTDSSGLQDESSYLGIPCFTCLEATHRIDTVLRGTNQLVGAGALNIELNVLTALQKKDRFRATLSDNWDGNAASRIVDVLAKH